MTAEELTKLRADLEAEIRAGVPTEDIEEWADAYYFGRRDLVDLIRTFYVSQGQKPSATDGS